MSAKGEPQITPCKSSDNYTKVTFRPDLRKFGMDTLEQARELGAPRPAAGLRRRNGSRCLGSSTRALAQPS